MTNKDNFRMPNLGVLLVAVLTPTILVGVDSLVLPTQQGQQQCRGQPQHALRPSTKNQYISRLPIWHSQQHRQATVNMGSYSFALHSSTESALNGEKSEDDDSTIPEALETAKASKPQNPKTPREIFH